MSLQRTSARVVIIIVIILFFCHETSSLKNVRILAPETVETGKSVRLICEYDLENEPLYSIRWYFNSNEFYSFLPKESPPTRVFPETGIIVDMTQSDNISVTLRTVKRQLTGFYKCEITTDYPDFETDMKIVLVVVTEKPATPPFLLTEKSKYSEGDVIKANCTSRRGYPAANLTWFVNDRNITDPRIKNLLKNVSHCPLLVSNDTEELENSTSTLELIATSDIFSKGRLTLACEATQFSLYKDRTQVNLLEDVPQLAHVLSPARSRSYSDKLSYKIFHWLTLCNVICWRYLKCR